MLAALVILVTCLFFLGVGLLISTNPLVVLSLAVVGLIIGGLAGILLLRGRVSQGYHWSIFAGPAATSALFVLLCGVLNLLVSDNLGLNFGGPRMYSVALLLGTAPGLLIGLVLGTSLSSRAPRRASQQLTGAGQSAQASRAGAGSRQPAPPLRPPSPILPPELPGQASTGLAQRLAAEVSALSGFGTVQIRDLNDGTVCVIVTRPQDGTALYLVCAASYPQQPPLVSAERGGAQLPIGSGIHFPWTSSSRLETIALDLYGDRKRNIPGRL